MDNEKANDLLNLTVNLAAEIVKYRNAVTDKKGKRTKDRIIQNIKDMSEVIAGISRNS